PTRPEPILRPQGTGRQHQIQPHGRYPRLPARTSLRKKSAQPPTRCAMKKTLDTNILLTLIPFSIWSLRRRAGQVLPVALAFLLLIFATQTIGTLHDISSIATQQKIAQSWRGPYDLFIRPQAAVSQLERTTNWID